MFPLELVTSAHPSMLSQGKEMTPCPVGTEEQSWTPSSNFSVGSEKDSKSPEMEVPEEDALGEDDDDDVEASLDAAEKLLEGLEETEELQEAELLEEDKVEELLKLGLLVEVSIIVSELP